MCYSLSLQSPIDYRNRQALQIHGDRAILISNSATLGFPSLPERDRRGQLFLCHRRGVESLRFGRKVAVKLCGIPRHRLRVHCSDARRIPEDRHDAEETAVATVTVTEQPDFSEFITSERVKVVAMLALALALCNADRVVMSVAIVPLSLSRGWSKSFSGIVQVILAQSFDFSFPNWFLPRTLRDCHHCCHTYFLVCFYGSHHFYGDT